MFSEQVVLAPGSLPNLSVHGEFPDDCDSVLSAPVIPVIDSEKQQECHMGTEPPVQHVVLC